MMDHRHRTRQIINSGKSIPNGRHFRWKFLTNIRPQNAGLIFNARTSLSLLGIWWHRHSNTHALNVDACIQYSYMWWVLTGCGPLSEKELNLIPNHNLNSESEADAEFGLCAEAMEASKSCPTEARAPLFFLSLNRFLLFLSPVAHEG